MNISMSYDAPNHIVIYLCKSYYQKNKLSIQFSAMALLAGRAVVMNYYYCNALYYPQACAAINEPLLFLLACGSQR